MPKLNIKIRDFSFSLEWEFKLHVWAARIFIPIGALSLTAPWWWPLVTMVFGFAGIDMPTTSSIIGLGLVGIGALAWVIGFLLFDRPEKRRLEDRALFNAQPLQVEGVRNFLDGLTTHDSYAIADRNSFTAEHSRFDEPNKPLCDPKTASRFADFRTDARNLDRFLDDEFYVFPETEADPEKFRFALNPRLNIDRAATVPTGPEQRQYFDLRDQLDQAVADVRSSYSNLLDHLHKLGHI